MKLILLRNKFTDISTQGDLFVENTAGVRECYTMEPGHNDPYRPKGPIPEGTYEIKMEFSHHFDCNMPHLQDVPGFTYIMIHPLNWPNETHGCIGVGTEEEKDKLDESHKAFDILLPKIKDALRIEKVFIDVREEIQEGKNELA